MTVSEIAPLLSKAIEVSARLRSADVNNIWPHAVPNPGASTDALREVERRLGRPLGAEHRRLLQLADGWVGFYHDVDLLSTSDLLGGARLDRAWLLAISADEGSDGSLGVSREIELPVAVSAFDVDVFLVGAFGRVRWIAGHEIEVFDNMTSFLGEMTRYNQQALGQLLEDPWLGAG